MPTDADYAFAKAFMRDRNIVVNGDHTCRGGLGSRGLVIDYIAQAVEHGRKMEQAAAKPPKADTDLETV